MKTKSVQNTIKAILGPTNTGKTHYAVERMMGHASGMMGFPLRLLAREVYDRVVAVKGLNAVALLTGEERIVPKNARYFLCTAEAMPHYKDVAFLAVDEVQMAADLQRGHIFTHHMLHSRGSEETLLLGAATMEPIIRRLIPEAEIIHRERFSTLSYVKPHKITRLPRRSAVIAFSAEEVYGIAELLRRTKGGAAIVMGALSPRTRNAQVELYQSGEVDYLVATDAIGMGLNMDINHVAFAATTKFDGRTIRQLRPNELAQIAGRAGRYQKNGTFTTLGDNDSDNTLEGYKVSQIENHTFAPVTILQWRNAQLDFTTTKRLIGSLEKLATTKGLHRVRDPLDIRALKHLSKHPTLADLANSPEAVRCLWDVCQIPDFRKLSDDAHFTLLHRIFSDLRTGNGKINHDWVAKEVKRLDNSAGEIDTLAQRIASIRIWTYVAHRNTWLQESDHWAHVTRGVEDKLSDALHEKLTQRFVDRRTAVLIRELRQKGALNVDINENNDVTIEGQLIGQLHGFSFVADTSANDADEKSVKAATHSALLAEITRRAKIFANVGYKTATLDFSNGLHAGRVMWEGHPIATLTHSGAYLGLRTKLLANSLLEGDTATLVSETLQKWLDERIAERLDPLMKLSAELNGTAELAEGVEPLAGTVRGVAFQLMERYGILPREAVAEELRKIDQDQRKGLRRFGVRIGSTSIYIPFILKPHATEMRLAMWAMMGEHKDLPAIPTPGMVWVEADPKAPLQFYTLAGFRKVGKLAIRMDMLERLADAVRPLGQTGNEFEVSPEIMGLVGVSGEGFAEAMAGIGYKHEVRKMPPVKQPEAEATPPEENKEKPKATDATAPAKTTDAKPEGDAADGEELVDRYFFKWGAIRVVPARKKREITPKAGGKNAALFAKAKSTGTGKPTSKAKPAHPKHKKREKPIDADSPFAALMSLKEQLEKKK